MRRMSKKKRGSAKSRKAHQVRGTRHGTENPHTPASSFTKEPKRKLAITVNIATPTPNTWVRSHWSKYQKIKQQWFDLIWEATIHHYGRGKFGPPVQNASLTIERRGLKKLDYDNLVGGLKPVIDALTKLGYLEDDTNDVIETLSAKQQIVRSHAEVGTEITIVEV